MVDAPFISLLANNPSEMAGSGPRRISRFGDLKSTGSRLGWVAVGLLDGPSRESRHPSVPIV
jgi:hypothetical protein